MLCPDNRTGEVKNEAEISTMITLTIRTMTSSSASSVPLQWMPSNCLQNAVTVSDVPGLLT